MPKIKINTFGEGIEIRQLHLDSDTYQHWQSIATKKNRTIPDLILDPFFYYSLRNKNIQQLTDIEATLIAGMLNTPKSQIEIWFDRRKVLKVSSNELFNDLLLFPLFKIEVQESFLMDELSKGIYTVQKTIGLLRSEKLQVDSQKLNIDDFTFKMSTYENQQFFTGVTYQNESLNYIKSETIISYETAFEII